MKKIITVLLSFVMVSGLLLFPKVSSAAQKFKDVENHWAKSEIEYLISKGIISGYADGTFKPGETVTRAQAAIMIGRSLGLDGTPRNTRFKDVPAIVTGSGYIDALYQSDRIVGYTDYIYRPASAVTRAQIAENINRAYPIPNKTGSPNKFSDISAETRYYHFIINTEANGIADGFADGTFRPNKSITRAEIAVILTRTLKLTQNK